MPSRVLLSNDSTISGGGIEYDEEVLYFSFANESSATGGAGASATLVPVGIAKAAGTIADVFVGVVLPPVSASGFVSGTTIVNARINSAAVCSTTPSIAMAGSAGQAVRVATNMPANAASGLVTSAVVNAASAAFSAGDQISIDWNTISVGSAAAGAAGKGLYVGVKLRYNAR